MKKVFFAVFAVFAGSLQAFAQTTATDFTANDCSGTSYHLFDELDAGKIIVVSFVMPCVGCILPSLDVQSVVESYNTSHPGKVVMYLADDDAATPCTTLTGWRNAHGLHIMPTFSTPLFVQDQYGVPGMPKIVVLGGTDHHIYYNQNNTVNTTTLANAIDAALGITTAVGETSVKAGFDILPNPANNRAAIVYSATFAGNVGVSIIDVRGRVVKKSQFKSAVGENSFSIDIADVAAGTYVVKLTDKSGAAEKKLVVR